jgi:hypothetical protein
MEPTHITFVGVLNTCVSTAALEHEQVIESSCELTFCQMGGVSLGDAWGVFNRNVCVPPV